MRRKQKTSLVLSSQRFIIAFFPEKELNRTEPEYNEEQAIFSGIREERRKSPGKIKKQKHT
jgi:hypothetical protein